MRHISVVRKARIDAKSQTNTSLSSSLSDTYEYRKFCELASKDNSVFSKFRTADVYTAILEHVSFAQGQAYIDLIQSRHAYLMAYLDKFKSSDSVGGAALYEYAAPWGRMSPTTLRYIYTLGEIVKQFGSLDGIDVIEIGAGYGGQCKIFYDLFNIRTYTIIDLPECLLLQRRFLENLGVYGVRYIDCNAVEYQCADLLISNYAFSECTKIQQLEYINRVIKHAKCGYMVYNAIQPDGYSIAEMSSFVNGTISAEEPLTFINNAVLTWNKPRTPAPKVSIVMAYKDRKKLLHASLQTICKYPSRSMAEVVIVDDASQDPLSESDFAAYDIDIRIISIAAKDRWWINPCVPYNIGFKNARGDTVLIQCPESAHYGDIVSYINKHCNDNVYISFSCYAVNEALTNSILSSGEEGYAAIFPLSHKEYSIHMDAPGGWYNHPVYRPTHYHFAAAISRSKLLSLGGFDEQYAHGFGFDDDDLVLKVKKANLRIVTPPLPLMVVHLWHSNINQERWEERMAINKKVYLTKDPQLQHYYPAVMDRKKKRSQIVRKNISRTPRPIMTRRISQRSHIRRRP